MAGALLYVCASRSLAQVVQPPASEVPIPVKPKTDSTPADSTRMKTDTIKAPFGRFADPVLYETGPQYEWNREQLFATGALTVADLLDRVPQVTTFRSGWLATPQTAVFGGSFRSVRIFFDGVELDDLDNSTGGVLDLSTVQLWTLEHVSIERSAGELRVFLRSWRVDNTTPYTRADITTGNEETNLYRGFYGKRFDGGGVLQLAGEEYGVRSSRFAGSGDGLSLLARVGVARKYWSVDGFMTRTHATRDIQRPLRGEGRPPVLGLDATHNNAYLRAAVGGVESGPWAQISVASLGFKGTTAPDRGVGATSEPDTTARRTSETQYNLSAGYTKGVARFEVGDRLRTLAGNTYNSPSGRLDFVTPLGALSGFVERDGLRGVTSADVGLRAQPLSFVAFSGSITKSTGNASLSPTIRATSVRGEAGLKILGPWVSAGLISTDKGEGPAPVVYDTLLLPTSPGRRSALIGSIRGSLGRGFGIDAWVTRWDSTRAYQPRYQSRSEINFSSNFRNRFPRGDFELRVAGIYEYRGYDLFPLAGQDVRVGAAKTLSAILEIRVLRAVVTYQQRNILGYQYEVVPGFEMPRVLAIYGVRWEFWN